MTSLVLLALTLALPGQDRRRAEPPTANPGPALAKLARELLEEHNKERGLKKLPPLTLDDRLNAAAVVHARDMAQHQSMSHEGSDKSLPLDRIKKQKYHYVVVAENVASGQETVKEVVEAWMKSPGHRVNVLGEFTHMGAAVFKDLEGTPYWAVEFGTPMPKLDPEVAAREVVERINNARSDAEKTAVRLSVKLQKAAMATSAAYARQKAVEPEIDADPHVRQEKYRYKTFVQSVVGGAPTPEALVKALLASDDHKEPFLADFSEVGVGYVQDDEETPYWCVLLAKPAR